MTAIANYTTQKFLFEQLQVESVKRYGYSEPMVDTHVIYYPLAVGNMICKFSKYGFDSIFNNRIVRKLQIYFSCESPVDTFETSILFKVAVVETHELMVRVIEAGWQKFLTNCKLDSSPFWDFSGGHNFSYEPYESFDEPIEYSRQEDLLLRVLNNFGNRFKKATTYIQRLAGL